jgi:hypothetical protein
VNWDAVGAIAELIGALATVAMLAYLAVQIRQSSNSVRVATATSRAEQKTRQSEFLSQSPELNRVFWAGLDSPDSLSEPDLRYFESIFSAYLSTFEASFNLNREAALSPADWEAQLAALGWLVKQQGFKWYWEKWREVYPKDWAAFLEEMVRRSDAPTPPAPSK